MEGCPTLPNDPTYKVPCPTSLGSSLRRGIGRKLSQAPKMRAALRTAAAAAPTADIAAACCSGAHTGCSARPELRLPSAGLDGLRRGPGRAFARVGVQVSALLELVRGRGLQRWGGEEPEDANSRARPHKECVHKKKYYL